MHKDVRAIRVTLARVRDIQMSHTRRDQKLRVIRDMIRAVWDRYRDEGSDDALMLVDHLRAAWALCHEHRATGDNQFSETHSEVKQRLWLADEVLEFLILKLEEDGQAPTLWHSLDSVTMVTRVSVTSQIDPDEIPF